MNRGTKCSGFFCLWQSIKVVSNENQSKGLLKTNT